MTAPDLPTDPIEGLDAFVEVLADVEAGVTTDAFYGRLCGVICRLAAMDIAVLFRYDEAVRRVRAAGAHGLDVAIFEEADVSVESNPLARRALEQDAVVEADAPFTGELPDEYATLLPGGTLYCVPLALAHRHADLAIEVDPDSSLAVPPHLESLAQSVLAEALRNAHKHAKPTRVTVRTGSEDGAFIMEVANDGVASSKRRSAGMGLRLAAFEALGEGGVVEFGPRNGGWQVRLVVPVDDES
jgi:hypothetical protein